VTGFVDDVRPYIEEASVYVCPIRDGGGTKLKILDALAMGKVIIAHPISCEGIDVVDGESILYASTAEEYVYQFERVMEDLILREKIEKGARRVVEEKYSFAAIGRDLASSYSLLTDLKKTIAV